MNIAVGLLTVAVLDFVFHLLKGTHKKRRTIPYLFWVALLLGSYVFLQGSGDDQLLSTKNIGLALLLGLCLGMTRNSNKKFDRMVFIDCAWVSVLNLIVLVAMVSTSSWNPIDPIWAICKTYAFADH